MTGNHDQWKVLGSVKRWKLESNTVGTSLMELRLCSLQFLLKDNIGNWSIVRTGLRNRIKTFVELKSMCTWTECRKTGLHHQNS